MFMLSQAAAVPQVFKGECLASNHIMLSLNLLVRAAFLSSG